MLICPFINSIGTIRIRFVVMIANSMQIIILCLSILCTLHFYWFYPCGNSRDKNGKQIEGSYHDKRVVIEEDGTEKAMYSGMFFISNRNFDRSSLVTTGWIDAEQKAIEAYEAVTGYVPIEELKQYYNRALEIRNQLND